MNQKYIKNILYILEFILILISLKIAYDWVTNDFGFDSKSSFFLIFIALIDMILRLLEKDVDKDKKECPYDSERLHKNQNKIVSKSLERLKNLYWKEHEESLINKFLFVELDDKRRQLPVVILTKNEVDISKNISDTKDTNKVNDNFIEILESQCKRKIWNNDTYRLMSLNEQINELILGKSDYYKTLSTCDLHYYNFMDKNNKMIDCEGKEYENWFEKLKNIVLYNQFTTVSASLGCSTLLVVKNYTTNKFQYYIVDNSIAKNPPNTKHVIPSFMVQPTKMVTDIDDFQLQSDIQTQILKEFGEELLGMNSLEKIDNQLKLESLMKENEILNKLRELLENGKATLKILGVSLDIFRLRPELLTVMVIEDESFFKQFTPTTSWEASSEDKKGLIMYNIDDEKQYYKLMFDDETPLVSPATACLKLGRDYVLDRWNLKK